MELEIGKIVTFEPSDSFEYGVIYRVSDGGRWGMGAFHNECSCTDSLVLRPIVYKDDKVEVSERYIAKIRDGQTEPGALYKECGGTENDLTALMKIAVNSPNEIAALFDGERCYKAKEWPCKVEFAKFRKAVCDILVNCEWARIYWPSCPKEFQDYE